MGNDDYVVPGFKVSAAAAGIKKDGSPDLALIYSEREFTAAGVFTTNLVQAAPVLVTREHLSGGTARAVVANAGNANACNGPVGLRDARATAALTADGLEIRAEEVLVASTGVIGLPLDMARIERALPELVGTLSPKGLPDAAEAIMTSDSFPKLSSVRGEAGGEMYRIAGIAKGAGMIMPDMATMLSFILTDVRISPGDLQTAVGRAVERSFNRITVDGDTSTNDTVLVLASGLCGNSDLAGSDLAHFTENLTGVMDELARMIVRDGEGATKVVDIRVRSARSAADRVDLWIDQVQIVAEGVGLGKEAEERAAEAMTGRAFTLSIDLHQGEYEDRVTTCDLTHEYVSINADYRTCTELVGKTLRQSCGVLRGVRLDPASSR
ncbi:MAG: bifunctional ornithine acetyltransferase/N-acetylglutamate synthase [Deltaproteobacteria bacterium]|nr:bifunctional ornithine acetyltransferase/N-acetylglutamate synthase [Deltaproteobacteria bacterium]